MKTVKAITGVLVVVAFLAAGSFRTSAVAKTKPAAKVEHISLKVSGMYCPYCSKNLESSLCKFKGAEHVKANYKTGMASLDIPVTSKVSSVELKKAVAKAGFELKDVKYTVKKATP